MASVTVRGVDLIAMERQRQESAEGWTSAHDDEHVNGELRDAAMAYVLVCENQCSESHRPDLWPWEPASWKPSGDPVRNLAKAGALIAAEIDRLQRRKAQSPAAGRVTDAGEQATIPAPEHKTHA